MTVLHLRKFHGPVDADVLAGLRRDGARLFQSVDGDVIYAYFDSFTTGSRLVGSLRIEGEAAGRAAPFRYIVETDVLPEQEADFNAWYAEEHLPGLAAVPGTVRAEQFLVEGSGPRYHSIYDLASIETFNSAPWLAVRATAWSDRVRPAFRNTIRTMFRAI